MGGGPWVWPTEGPRGAPCQHTWSRLSQPECQHAAYESQSDHHPQGRLETGAVRGNARDKGCQDATDHFTGSHTQAKNSRRVQWIDTFGRNGRHEQGEDSVESPADEEDGRQYPDGAVEIHRSVWLVVFLLWLVFLFWSS